MALSDSEIVIYTYTQWYLSTPGMVCVCVCAYFFDHLDLWSGLSGGCDGWRTVVHFFQVNTCADLLVLVSPKVVHTLRPLCTLKIYFIQDHFFMRDGWWHRNTQITLCHWLQNIRIMIVAYSHNGKDNCHLSSRGVGKIRLDPVAYNIGKSIHLKATLRITYLRQR